MATDKLKKALVLLLSSSDSESDFEEIEEIIKKQPVPKITNYITDVVNKMNKEQFKRHFRLSLETVDMLVQKFESSIFFPKIRTRGGKVPITARTHILSFLWFAGNKSTLRETADRFGISLSSVTRISERVMDFLISLGPSTIKMPQTSSEKQQVANAFESFKGFPGVLGCIDGTSIRIRTPVNKIKSTYTNRHDLPSINLQGICDSKRRFMDIFTGIPGKIHDSRVLKMSDISKSLPEICGNNYHILGDNAYPIRKWLLVPYRDYGNLSERERHFNKKLSSTRVLIENTFGILKGRFRQLLALDMHTVPKMTKFIISCCILHNICIDNNDLLEDIIHIENNNNPNSLDTDVQLKHLGELKRNGLRDYLFNLK